MFAKFSNLFLLSVAVIILNSVRQTSAIAEGGHGHAADHAHIFENLAPKRTVTVNYQRYSRGFLALCNALDKDGRRTLVYKIVLQRDYRDASCLGCKSFFLEFRSACSEEKYTAQQKRNRKNKHSHKAPPASTLSPHASEHSTLAPTITPIIKQRDPSTAVVLSAAEIAAELAGDERIREYNRQVVNILVGLFLLPQNVTAAEKEYLSRIAGVFTAAFAEFPVREHEHHAHDSKGVNAPASQSVDDLFK